MLLKHKSISLENNSTKLLINFKEDTKLKDIINIANNNCELISIVPSKPSMDEIFIQTVEKYNKS